MMQECVGGSYYYNITVAKHSSMNARLITVSGAWTVSTVQSPIDGLLEFDPTLLHVAFSPDSVGPAGLLLVGPMPCFGPRVAGPHGCWT